MSRLYRELPSVPAMPQFNDMKHRPTWRTDHASYPGFIFLCRIITSSNASADITMADLDRFARQSSRDLR